MYVISKVFYFGSTARAWSRLIGVSTSPAALLRCGTSLALGFLTLNFQLTWCATRLNRQFHTLLPPFRGFK